MDLDKSTVEEVGAGTVIFPVEEGWYRCVAKNSEGVVFKDTYLTVTSSTGQMIMT
jgi:hypothetical protein